jgi:uncharacterized membrane protein HdeD (DUF308 family)
MVVVLASNWWTLVLRGVLAIIFGVVTFLMPGVAIGALVLLFGAYVFVEGIFNIIAGLRAPKGYARWWTLLLEGVISVIAGLLAFFYPLATTVALLYLIAFWAIVTGVFEIATAIRLRRQMTSEIFLILSGIVSILFGALLIFAPAAGALAVVWYIGIYAIIFGALLIGAGFKLRGWMRAAAV